MIEFITRVTIEIATEQNHGFYVGDRFRTPVNTSSFVSCCVSNSSHRRGGGGSLLCPTSLNRNLGAVSV